jgi:uncharacterized membrane protein
MSNSEVNLEWRNFGSKMKIVAIFTILIFIPLVGLIFSILALIHIKNINSQLNNPLLEDYRSKYISALIVRLIGAVVGLVGLFFPLDLTRLLMYGDMSSLTPYFVINGIGWIIAIIAGAIEMGAWGALETFFRQNATMFPAYISREAEEGSHYLRNAALMYILSFLIITVLIGWIFQIIGFFKVAKLEQVMNAPMTAPTAQPTPTRSPTSPPASVKYCPNCGADVTGAGKFCGTCGSPLA